MKEINIPSKKDLRTELQELLNMRNLQEQISIVADFRNKHSLRASELETSGSIPIMKASDYLTWLAEAIIEEIVDNVWVDMTPVLGIPTCKLGDTVCEKGFAVIAYGKLGGIELSYSSDLDMVFLHAGDWSDTTGGQKTIDSAQYYIKMGQKVLNLLTGSTGSSIYETDLRLRPDGTKGLLVVQVDGYHNYLLNKAWTWEHQALIRARAIYGDPLVLERFQRIRKEVICLDRDPGKLRNDIVEMRNKITLTKDINNDMFNLKSAKGGIVDIEFLVQYLVLLYSSKKPALTEWTDIIRITESLENEGIFTKDTANLLRNSYLTFRAEAHKLSLEGKEPFVEQNAYRETSEKVIAVWDEFLS